ncbi:MAG: hypothetical protein DYH08_10460 [Actinobacteria bacterium ATB1]|nr:hypothetical protein [Actinobacteria bacterium ATB1]
MSGDSHAALGVVRSLGDRGVAVETLLSEVVAAAMARVGESWQAYRASITQEHRASGIRNTSSEPSPTRPCRRMDPSPRARP